MKRAALYIAASIAAFILAGVPPALAQEEEGPEGGISAYAVARVKVLDGSVWVRPSDGGDWEEFSSNSPIPPRSRVSVPDGSEAELQFHGGQFVLLTSGTDLEVRDLQEGKSVFRLRAGEIRFDLPPDDFAPVSVRVPGGAVAQFPVPGRQWLTVTDSDETRLVVRRGSAVVTVEGDEHRLRAGQEAVIGRDVAVGPYRGGADESAEPPPPSEEAERQGDAPPVVVNELREYGEWVDVPTYGTRLAAARGGGLVPLRVRPLGVDLPVRMDVGFQRAVGVVSVPVRVLADRPGLRVDLVSVQLVRIRQLRFRLEPISAPQCFLPARDGPLRPRGQAMSAGCRCGRGSGSARPDSLAAMPGSRGGTVRSTAAGSSFAGGRIAANGATIAPCAPSGRRRSGRPAPRSRGRTPARCVRRSGRFALPPLSNGRKAPNRRRGEAGQATGARPAPREDRGTGATEGGPRRAREGGTAGASSQRPRGSSAGA